MDETAFKGDAKAKIAELKERRNAVILAHNYQLPEVQDIADFTGDSLELSKKAANLDAEVIVFCGVHFMAETAAILSPKKTVLLPDPDAGCPMADMVTAEDVSYLRSEHPGAVVVCYVNSTAEVKAVSDLCCTSANAVDVVSRIPQGAEIIFVPDRHLGSFVQEKTGRSMILWPGYCPTHDRFLPVHVQEARTLHPDAKVVVHPECRPVVRHLADEVLGTGGMCRFAAKEEVKEVVVGTEPGMLHRLKKENPGKKFVPLLEQAICPNMKRITLEKIASALEEMKHRVVVPDEIRTRAEIPIMRMMEQGEMRGLVAGGRVAAKGGKARE